MLDLLEGALTIVIMAFVIYILYNLFACCGYFIIGILVFAFILDVFRRYEADKYDKYYK